MPGESEISYQCSSDIVGNEIMCLLCGFTVPKDQKDVFATHECEKIRKQNELVKSVSAMAQMPKGKCIKCYHFIRTNKDPKKCKCKVRYNYTTNNALRYLTCADYIPANACVGVDCLEMLPLGMKRCIMCGSEVVYDE